MPKAYWISHIEVLDQDQFTVYAKGAMAAFAIYGGRPLVRGGKVRGLEGTSRPRNIIIEFDSMEAALRCYESSEYQQAKAHRDGNANADLMILEGLE
jgi:uncharacterized protein (DUF1330 family)